MRLLKTKFSGLGWPVNNGRLKGGVTIPFASTPGFSKKHFAPGLESSCRSGLIGVIRSRSLETSSCFPIAWICFSSEMVRAARGTTLRKNPLSRLCIDRLTGGRKSSGSNGELRCMVLGTVRITSCGRVVESSRRREFAMQDSHKLRERRLLIRKRWRKAVTVSVYRSFFVELMCHGPFFGHEDASLN